jgi:hypothetical protein
MDHEREKKSDDEVRDEVLALQETKAEEAEVDVQAHTSTASYVICSKV